MSDLQEKRCVACESGVPTLKHDDIVRLLTDIPNWEINTEETIISRHFTFKNFYKTMSFVNAVAWVANQENHHPDLEVGYNYCLVKYSTHAINGLSMNDFICAAKINGLVLE
jgi:4a-hydroxytetrahydrobiopterin dehydratase